MIFILYQITNNKVPQNLPELIITFWINDSQNDFINKHSQISNYKYKHSDQKDSMNNQPKEAEMLQGRSSRRRPNHKKRRGQQNQAPEHLHNFTTKSCISHKERQDRVLRNLTNRSITTNGKIYRRRETEIQEVVIAKAQPQPQPVSMPIKDQNNNFPNYSLLDEEEEPSSEQSVRIVIQPSEEDSSSYVQNFDEEEELRRFDQSEGFDIQQFILDNNIGEKSKYRLPKRNNQISDCFKSKNNYVKTMLELVKYEIISDVNRRIEEKNEEKYQGQIKVELSSEQIRNKYTGQYDKKIILKARGRNSYFLDEILFKGKRLAIVTRAQSFTIRNLITKQYSTRLCFVWKDRDSGNILVRGLEMLEISRPYYQERYKDNRKHQEDQQQQQLLPNEYYLMDLDSIISSVRQYRAIQNIIQSPLIKNITNHTPVSYNPKVKKERKKHLNGNQVFQRIKQQRNKSQIDTISTIFKQDSGIFLIQGPPGTGKTECIANFSSLEQRYFKKSESILDEGYYDIKDKLMICAQSNAAVNHIGRKLLKDKMIGRNDMPKILRLGHTEEFDELLLSINLPHLCEIQLRNTQKNPDDWSAKLRWQRILLREKINRIMEETPKQRAKIKQEKNELFKRVKRLVEINEDLVTNQEEYEKIEQSLLESSEIVLSTLNTSGKAKFAKFYRDRIRCLLIDEASQATQPSTLIPFATNVEKVILVGDHMQLQPTVMSTNCRFTRYNRSLFERLALKNHPLLLDTQYRMVPTLMHFPSDTFYEGRLICGRDMKQNPFPYNLQDLKSSCMFFDVVYGRQELMKKSFINEAEADCVSILIQRLHYLAPKLTIGVIAPYKGQVKLIESKVYKVLVRDAKLDNLRISTVDAFQGQERDVIIISTVRSNPDRNIGFVRDEKRLNVAITRAKNALFVFGSANTLSSNDTWANYLNYHRGNNSMYSLPSEEKSENIIRQKIELRKAT